MVMRFTQSIVILLTLLFFISCKKEETITPEEEELISSPLTNGIGSELVNGYFLASLNDYNLIIDKYNSAYFFACFADPETRLLKTVDRRYNQFATSTQMNVSVGNVDFAGFHLQPRNNGNTAWYNHQQYDVALPEEPVWKTEGNKTFTSIHQSMNRGFPSINIKDDRISVNPKKVINFKFEGIFENCDSVGIEIFHYPDKIYKVASRSSDSISFSPAEVRFMKEIGALSVFIWASNYSSRTLENKKYVFELMRREQKILFVDTLL